ncbi:MAG: heavy metal-associated domain-containing protein [Pseudomonadota bacterium]|nr:heavy metal-associated domain-containing protein [Pseudomonadota bacterium]
MPSQTDTLLAVEGMTCHSCVSHVKKALLEVDGVEKVDVRFSERRVRVRHDADAAPIRQLVEALAEAGYPATPAS